MPNIQEIVQRTLRVDNMILCKASLYGRMVMSVGVLGKLWEELRRTFVEELWELGDAIVWET